MLVFFAVCVLLPFFALSSFAVSLSSSVSASYYAAQGKLGFSNVEANIVKIKEKRDTLFRGIVRIKKGFPTVEARSKSTK